LEEFISSLIHGFGALLSSAILSLLVVLAAIHGSTLSVVTSAIFGTSMVVVFLTSTLYHAVTNQDVKLKIKRVDHIVIYYLIAGTYTPFCLVNLGDGNGWIIFGIIWALAVFGTIMKIILPSSSGTKFWSIGLNLLMGWLVVFSLPPVVRKLPNIGLMFLFAGGLFYTVGVVFYLMKKVRFTHAIWHFFVLCGAIMHSFAVLYSCILPME
jgi:hemolysin III